MPRENSFTDSDGRSLTPDLDDALLREAEYASSEPLTEISVGRRGLNDMDAAFSSSPAVLNPYTAEATTSRNPGRPSIDDVLRPTLTTPGDRFRATVRKVMTMNRTASSMLLVRPGVGAEPGIDPRSPSAYLNYGHIKQRCVIEVIDYSTLRINSERMTNNEFVKMMRDSSMSRRDPWVRVRWINIGGVSWDVISALALKFDIHPLALEDIVSQRQHTRSKVDYYPQHLFLRILCHSLIPDESGSADASFTELPRSQSPDLYGVDDSSDHEESRQTMAEHRDDTEDEGTVYGSASGSRFSTRQRQSLKRRFSGGGAQTARKRDVEQHAMQETPTMKPTRSFFMFSEKKKKVARDMKLVGELKRGDRVNVRIHPVCIFLFRDGTVICINRAWNRDNNVDFTAPITERLRQRHTGLRKTADPSLLVESLLDLMVDSALEVVEEYQVKILKIEQEVLLQPRMRTVRRSFVLESQEDTDIFHWAVHILQGDLILHRRTLEPIKTVIYGLRRYDEDRVAALSEKVDPRMKIEGYMSHKSKIYLADVHDHMEYILTSLDMFAGVSENLINYTFNMASYEMNEVMRRLTLATIIFLPLTLLTGYFGMNFDSMWSIHHGHSDLVFWIIALPVMALVIPMFLSNDLRSMVHYLQKRLIKHQVKRTFRQ